MSGGFTPKRSNDPTVRVLAKQGKELREGASPLTPTDYTNILLRLAALEAATGTTPPAGTITT